MGSGSQMLPVHNHVVVLEAAAGAPGAVLGTWVIGAQTRILDSTTTGLTHEISQSSLRESTQQQSNATRLTTQLVLRMIWTG
jgi:hypothetical protein